MTIPRELKLIRHNDDLTLIANPVKELENLRTDEIQIDQAKLNAQSKAKPILITNGVGEIELEIDFEKSGSSHVVIEFFQ